MEQSKVSPALTRWLSSLGAVLESETPLVQSPAWAHAWVAVRAPVAVSVRGNQWVFHNDISLPPLPLFIQFVTSVSKEPSVTAGTAGTAKLPRLRALSKGSLYSDLSPSRERPGPSTEHSSQLRAHRCQARLGTFHRRVPTTLPFPLPRSSSGDAAVPSLL